jgi:hypothetical protein
MCLIKNQGKERKKLEGSKNCIVACPGCSIGYNYFLYFYNNKKEWLSSATAFYTIVFFIYIKSS